MSNELAPTESLTVENDIRFLELVFCAAATNPMVRGLVIYMIVATVTSTVWYSLTGHPGALGLAFSVAVLGCAIFGAMWANYRKNYLLMSHIRTSITPHNLVSRIEKSGAESRFPWTKVLCVRRVGKNVVFSVDTDPVSWIYIPFRCFSSQDDALHYLRIGYDYWRIGQAKKHELGKCAPDTRGKGLLIARYVAVFVLLGLAALTFMGQLDSVWPIMVVMVPVVFVLVRLSDDGRAATLEASLALARNDSRGALLVCDRALKSSPKNANLHVVAAYSLFNLARIEEGLKHCDAAVEAKPDLALAYLGRGFGRRENEQCEEALQDIRAGLGLEPNISWAYVLLASVLTEEARYDEAEAACNQALAIDPQYYGIELGFGGICYMRGEWDSALEHCEKALQMCEQYKRSDKEKSVSFLLKGLTHSRLGQHKEAMDSIDKSLSLDPECTFLHGSSAGIRSRAGELQEAAALFEQGHLNSPAKRYVLTMQADWAVNSFLLGDRNEAHRHADVAIEIGRRPYALVTKAALLERDGLNEEAQTLIDEALAKDPCCLIFKPKFDQ